MHDDFGDVFTGIGYIKGIFPVQIEDNMKSIPGTTEQCICIYTPGSHSRQELERLQEHQNTSTYWVVDKMAEWCNSFLIVP